MSRIHRKVISDMLGRFFLSTSLSTCLYVYLMWFIHEFLTLVHKFLKMYDHIKTIFQRLRFSCKGMLMDILGQHTWFFDIIFYCHQGK